MRASATLEGPLALACFMTVGIFALACSRDFFKNSLIYYGSLAVGVVGLLASQSRGSLIALFISGIVLSMALRKWGTAAATAGTAVAFGLALPFLEKLSPALAASMNGGSAEGHGKYFDYRQLLLERGLQEAAHHPIIGMHIDKVLLALADITQGEHIVDLVNVYLVILLVSGVVGLFPFLALTIRSGIRATTGFGRFNDLPFLRARGFCLAAFTVVLIQFSFVSFVGRIPMNFMLVLCGIRLIVMERSKRSAAFAMRGVSPAPGSAGQTPQAGGGAIQPTGYSGPFETPELPIMPA